MTVFDISAEITSAKPYPGDPETSVRRIRSIKNGDGYNLSTLSMSLHSGTHIDAPYHFLENGLTANEISLSALMGECSVVSFLGQNDDITGRDIEEAVSPGTRKVILKTLGECHLTRSAAAALISLGVELVGIDSNSIAVEDDEDYIHREMLMAGVILLEGLTLRHVQSGKYTLVAMPLKIDGVEAAPCRAILMKN